MSKQIYCDKGVRYAVQCREVGSRELAVSITDGIRVWYNEGSISYAFRPASRNRDSEEQYLSYLKGALQGHNVPGSRSSAAITEDFIFEVAVDSFNNNTLQLLIKERVEGTSAYSILFRGEFRQRREGEDAILDLVNSLGEMSQDKDKEIQRLKDQEKDYLSLMDKLRADTRNFSQWRDDVQDKQVRGFCMVLNSLKRAHAADFAEALEQRAAAAIDTFDDIPDPPPVTSSKTKKSGSTKQKAASKKKATSNNPSSTDNMKSKMTGKKSAAHAVDEDDDFMNGVEDGNDFEDDESRSVAPFEAMDLVEDSNQSSNIFSQKVSVHGRAFLPSQNLEIDGGNIAKLLQSQQQHASQPTSSFTASSSNNHRGNSSSTNQTSQLSSQSGLKRGAEEAGMTSQQLHTTQSTEQSKKGKKAAFLQDSDDEEVKPKAKVKPVMTSLDFF